jgi:hypothetical protein
MLHSNPDENCDKKEKSSATGCPRESEAETALLPNATETAALNSVG